MPIEPSVEFPGAISDATGSYDASFYTAGGFLILASLIGFIIYLPMLDSYRAPMVPAEPLDILEDIPEESESREVSPTSEKEVTSPQV